MTTLPDLPRRSPRGSVFPVPQGGAGAAPASRRVLVVEDEFFIADDIAEALRELGAEVIGPVPRLSEALNLIESAGPIDFAVLDVNLGGEACFLVGDALLAQDIPFVFATGYDRSFLPARFRNVPYWEKPFDPRSLAQALRELCEASNGHG
ncbi:response regulator [Roseomonas sp. KE2513]|uniref:response regulator n=1 Tax=Roseomonas sp. KE2513 TaxID=2479202 RepID=UPI001E378928|nr:response regulator [Roseomonas sp. KE2513]MBI0535915.1 response regulator [Roseomonas sp. KE2513]